MKSINAKSGKTVSELEATILYVISLLQDKVQEKPLGGIVFCKGKPNEIHIKYTDMVRVMDSLRDKLGIEGCMSYGICKTCSKFDSKNFSKKRFGYCGGTLKHEYDSCSKHSKTGGGFGV